MKTKLKKVKRVITDLVPIGYYLVTFDQIYGTRCNPGKHDDCLEHGCLDNEPSYVAEIDANLNKVTANNYLELDAHRMTLETNTDGAYSDEHDLRPRLFKTKAEAKAHIKYTTNRFANPQPWESFIKTA